MLVFLVLVLLIYAEHFKLNIVKAMMTVPPPTTNSKLYVKKKKKINKTHEPKINKICSFCLGYN